MIARTSSPQRFTAGWVRLPLRPCSEAAAKADAGRLEVEADRVLVFSPGRAGGATVGLLSGTEEPARGAVQAFAIAPSSGGAREIVLAPWPLASAPPGVAIVRLVGRPPP